MAFFLAIVAALLAAPSAAFAEPPTVGSTVPTSDPTEPPAVAPGPTPAPVASTGAPAPSAAASAPPSGATGGSAGSQGSTGSSSAGSGGGSAGSGGIAGAPASATAAPDASDSIVGASATPGAGESIALPGSQPTGGRLWTVLLVGVLAFVAVASLGSVWVLLGRERQIDQGSAPASEHARTSAGDEAAPVLGHRAVRRAQLAPTDDPILTALGLGGTETSAPPPRPPRARPRQVSTGLGERAVHRARLPRDTDW
jgi:hypothetical protein